jgi:hypothetical protein
MRQSTCRSHQTPLNHRDCTPSPKLQSVVNYPVQLPPVPDHTPDHMHIDLEDDESANLLEQLPGAMVWLEAALRQKGNRVLVHCHAGGRWKVCPGLVGGGLVGETAACMHPLNRPPFLNTHPRNPHPLGMSRSAAVVAALIMRAKRLEPYDSLVILRRAVRSAAPNAGFMDQLGVWADMGWCLNERHPSYKAFMLEQVGGGRCVCSGVCSGVFTGVSTGLCAQVRVYESNQPKPNRQPQPTRHRSPGSTSGRAMLTPAPLPNCRQPTTPSC